ncbi:MAG TPA: TonB family protein [Candidatus Limnocylindrales bacterium]|nr:TonB family protein [Candidatus Limnocylindrales bacterium]
MSTQLLTEPQPKPPKGPEPVPASVSRIVATAPERELFTQTLVQDSSPDRHRRFWTRFWSSAVQACVLVVLVLIPLWFTDALPIQQLATFLVAPPPPPPPPPPAPPTVKVQKIVSEMMNGQLRTPSKIPKEIKMIKEEEAPPPMTGFGVVGGVEGGVPGGQAGGVIGSILSSTAHTPVTQVVAAAPKKPLRVSSGISEGLLVQRVEPTYPAIAQRAHIQGTVRLQAIISKQGTIENLQLIEGHPMLVQAAIEAVKQWKYKPYILNGEPLEVETIVIVNFHLG